MSSDPTTGRSPLIKGAGILLVTLLLLAFFSLLENSLGKRPVSLLVFVVIDQLKPEYLAKFAPHCSGGIKRLLEQGALFSDAYHEHSSTETCPGHASLVTGVHPRRSGIVANGWFDSETKRPVGCVADRQDRLSPRSLKVSTLPDWIKKASSSTRVITISGKERSAILLGGHGADGAYWYNKESGNFSSSSYYSETGEEELDLINRAARAEGYYGRFWEPLNDPAELDESLGIHYLDTGVFADRFPRSLGSPLLHLSESFYDDLYATPFLDELTALGAQALVRTKRLGGLGGIDYLGVSFSALDVVGHRYGPQSPELFDTFIRLDRVLGELFKFLDDQVGADRYAVVLSSDHGAPELPEERQRRGEFSARIRGTAVSCFQQIPEKAATAYGKDAPVFEGGWNLSAETKKRWGSRLPALYEGLRALIEGCPFVEGVWTEADLSGDTPPTEPIARRYWNGFYPGRSPDLDVQLKEHVLLDRSRGISHGSPYDYDARVPVLFAGPGISAGSIEERIQTVDVAPTVAEYLGIPAPVNLDGISRGAAIGISR